MTDNPVYFRQSEFQVNKFLYPFQIQPGTFDFELCGKRCRGKGGLRRHQTAKHKTIELEAEEPEASEDIWTRTILFYYPDSYK